MLTLARGLNLKLLQGWLRLVSLRIGKVLSVLEGIEVQACLTVRGSPAALMAMRGSTEAVGGVLSEAARPVGCNVGWV